MRMTENPAGASAVGNLGLEHFWSGQFPAMRGYNLYVEFAEIAESSNRSNLRVAIWREAISLIDRDPDVFLRAIAHRARAEAATAAHMSWLAKQEYDEASLCLRRLLRQTRLESMPLKHRSGPRA